MNRNLTRFTKMDYILALGLATFSFLAYNATLTPSLSYLSPDGNELATVPYVLGLAHSPGYPLYTWLGKIFTWLPIGDVAHRMNLMSAILGSLSVGGLYLIILTLLHPKASSHTLRRVCSILASLLFAFSSTFWSQAVIAEVYTPNLAFVAFTLLALLYWEHTRRVRDFFLFALVFGLSLGMHLSNLGFAPAFALFILLTDFKVLKRFTWWLAGFLGFGMGIAQFLWLPLKANTLTDRMMLARTPTTLKGIVSYTLGAFSQLKFAFPLFELPDRLVIYLDLLRQQFTLFGILLGMIGLVAILIRRSRYYYLLVGMYLVHVWFFIQYQVFDLEVFFLPAHFVWAIFIAFGVLEILAGLTTLIQLLPGSSLRRILRFLLITLVLLSTLIPLLRNWSDNDRSGDVAVNDFYANLWEILPQESVLVTRSGVFGYDAFYWQLVYNTRDDVVLPTLPDTTISKPGFRNRNLFSNTILNDRGKVRGPGAIPPDLVPQDLWQVPILIGNQSAGGFGGRDQLILYELSMTPPHLVVKNAHPDIPLHDALGGAVLNGVDLNTQSIESGSRIDLVLYWEITNPIRYQVQTILRDQVLETHTLGFGNLERYAREIGSIQGQTIVENYAIVIPSTVEEGDYPLMVQIQGVDKEILLGTISVRNDEETMERWLRIAGK
jgi:hypothetical protein